jgi:hypothetical protein
MRLVTFNSFVL